jgi:uncharacterized protein YuzE
MAPEYDTLYIEFRDQGVAYTRDLDEKTTVDLILEGIAA